MKIYLPFMMKTKKKWKKNQKTLLICSKMKLNKTFTLTKMSVLSVITNVPHRTSMKLCKNSLQAVNKQSKKESKVNIKSA